MPGLEPLKVWIYQHDPRAEPEPQVVAAGSEWIELVLVGHGALLVDGAWRRVGPGDLLWHRAGQPTIGRGDRAAPYRCLAVRRPVDGRQAPPPRFTRWDDLAAATAFAGEAVRLWLDGRTARAVVIDWVLATLRLRAALHELPAALLPAPLVQLVQRIEIHYMHDLSVDDLAQHAGCSPQHLSRLARQHLGRGPHELLHQRRLRAVRELLGGTTMELAEICRHTGFSSPATLCRAFRVALGTSPAAWRNLSR